MQQQNPELNSEKIKPNNKNALKPHFLGKYSFVSFLKIFGIVVITILFWEHLVRKSDTTIRPSIGLQFVSKKSQEFFDWVGRTIAWISSYLTQIDLKEFVDTCWAIGKPTLEILASPFHVIVGYVVAANTYTNGILVYVGTGIIIIAVLFICYKYDYFKYLRPLRERLSTLGWSSEHTFICMFIVVFFLCISLNVNFKF